MNNFLYWIVTLVTVLLGFIAGRSLSIGLSTLFAAVISLELLIVTITLSAISSFERVFDKEIELLKESSQRMWNSSFGVEESKRFLKHKNEIETIEKIVGKNSIRKKYIKLLFYFTLISILFYIGFSIGSIKLSNSIIQWFFIVFIFYILITVLWICYKAKILLLSNLSIEFVSERIQENMEVVRKLLKENDNTGQ